MQPSLDSRITFTQPSHWVWNVWLDGKRVGTVNGDTLAGFTARDNDHHAIGQHYLSAEAAMQAWIPAVGSPTDVSSPTVVSSPSDVDAPSTH